ncbi:MAG TPA: CHAT domain-containing protein [Vicinamibacterales bacterium]|nr:CHAT domain-containing protein [Vicinamibacterales bacterium]
MRPALAIAVLAIGACTFGPRADRRFESDLASARSAIQRGDLSDASSFAGRAASYVRSDPQSVAAWRLELLRAEIALLQRDVGRAAPALSASLPADPAFDGLRARQTYLRAKQQIDDGHAADALVTIERARSIARGDPDLQMEIGALEGQIRLRLGQWTEAETTLTAVARQAAQSSDRYHEALALNNLGMSRFVRSRYDEALPYFEHVLAYEDLRDLSIYAASLSNAGACYARLGDFDRAMTVQHRAFEIHETRGPRIYFEQALGQMGNLEALRGHPHESAALFDRALSAAKAAGLNGDAELWAGNLAADYVQLQRWDDAERYNDEAKQLWSVTRGGSPLYHALYAAAIAAGRGQYDDALRMYDAALAAPSAPASLRWDAYFGRANAEIAMRQPARAAKDFEAALAVIETTRAGLLKTEYKVSYLTQLIAFYQAYVSALMDEHQVNRALEVADSSRGQVLAERQKTAAMPLGTADAFRRTARSWHAVLLSYWLMPSRSYLFVVSPTGSGYVELPPAEQIETLVRQHQRAIADATADPIGARDTPGDRLYRLLVAPAARWLTPGARVVIVPDGALHGLNFETLPVDGPRRHYWIEDAEVQIAPSLAALAPERPRQTSRTLLLIGNPAPRPEFPALANAPIEMSRIAGHFSPERVTEYEGERASPEAYRESRPDRFAFVHFAAHATANAESPLDSAVVLSGPEHAFKLYAREVSSLPLTADLVTVSACRSAGARAYAGEGLVGFSWAFLRAGARRVIAGLWDVDDQSTAALMDRLYAGLAAGTPPSAALRDAKLALIRGGGRMAAPYNWAAFELFATSP